MKYGISNTKVPETSYFLIKPSEHSLLPCPCLAYGLDYLHLMAKYTDSSNENISIQHS